MTTCQNSLLTCRETPLDHTAVLASCVAEYMLATWPGVVATGCLVARGKHLQQLARSTSARRTFVVPVKLASCGSRDGAAQITALHQTAACQHSPLLVDARQGSANTGFAAWCWCYCLPVSSSRHAEQLLGCPSAQSWLLQAGHPWSAHVDTSARFHRTSGLASHLVSAAS